MIVDWYQYLSFPCVVCFDNESEDGGDVDDKSGDDKSGDKSGDEQLLTQKQFNEALAKDRRKHLEQFKKIEKQYNDLLQKSSLTAEEKNNLEEALEDLRKHQRTKEQQAKFEKEQLEKTYSEKIAELEQRAKMSETKFVDMLVTRSLQDAAVMGDAFNPSQIIAILKPMVRIEDDQPVIDFPVFDEETGKTEPAKMTPNEAINHMKQMPELYGNMFKANVVSGVGGTSSTGVSPGANGRVDVRKLTYEQYRELRKKNPAAVGL